MKRLIYNQFITIRSELRRHKVKVFLEAEYAEKIEEAKREGAKQERERIKKLVESLHLEYNKYGVPYVHWQEIVNFEIGINAQP